MAKGSEAMWISGTDLPEELVSALIDDKLVVFAGAGVSMNPPIESARISQLGLPNRQGGGCS